MNINDLLHIDPYSLNKEEKQNVLSQMLSSLTKHHYNNCIPYKKILDSSGFNPNGNYNYTEIPFLPVRLFKLYELRSVDKKDVIKTMTSSGTSGQAVSRIYLDKETSANQTKVLSKIVTSFLGKQRVPMLIIDSEAVIKNRKMFSARGAGILGFSFFGSKRLFALDEEMNLKIKEIQEFLKTHKDERIFLFGFTFMVWQHFYKLLLEKNIKLDLSNAVLIHGGGWKKLISESISNKLFKEKLYNLTGIKNVHDYYGMVEQTGSIYMECEHGHLHTPVFSDVIIRRYNDFSEASVGEYGIIQVVSVLAGSYPGHSLLTEDEGVLLGEDNCPCGRKGKYFKIVGRLKNAELRGCSDTYAEKF